MWVIPPPELGDLEEELNLALNYTNGIPVYALSPLERAAIHVVYDLYDRLLGQPNAELTPNELDLARPHMHNAYNQVQIGGRLAKLRAQILASTDQCPYCGFGEPRDLDHYLPRSVYGELAIYPRNLIPSCSSCNNAKRTVVPGLGPAPGPGLIHAYFQNLPDVDFLRADVTFENGVLDVQYWIEGAELEISLADQLQFQLNRLKLNERYRSQINKFLSEQRAAMLMFNEVSPEHFAHYLDRCAVSLSDSFGRNDWRVALLRSLAECDEFCVRPELYLGA